MAFKVSDFHDLVELLETHPEWRAELRRLVLTEDVLALPRIVQELAEAQQRTEALVRELAEAQKRTEQRVEELAEAQKRTEQRLTRLEMVVQELAEAQKRTEQRVEELAEAQKRAEQRLTRLEMVVQELAEAQKRTEQRVEELAAAQKRTEQRVEELAGAQKRTEARVEQLAEEQKETRRQLAQLANRVGVSVEEEAADVLRVVMQRKGYRVVQSSYSLAWDGEIDVVLPLQDAQGQPVWAVVEAKVRLGRRAVEAWANRMRDPNFQAALRAEGVGGPYLVYAYGMRIDLGAREAAEQFGIGVLSSGGEEVPPALMSNLNET
jgi:DNA repair ATPase RecN